MRKIASLVLLFFLVACAPQIQERGAEQVMPSLSKDHLVTSDNRKLPLRSWGPAQTQKGIVIGVHGFNDYGHFLNPYVPDLLTQAGYRLITYDQRGFGENPDRGLFSSPEALSHDLMTLIQLVQRDYQPQRLYVLGESMGGAVVAATISSYPDLQIDGAILSAPAVWGPSTWPWIQRVSLNVMSHLVPAMSLSGGGIVQPTDNEGVWHDWSKDPLVVRGTRMDALYGVSLVMEAALNSAPRLKVPLLVLYGAQDEIIPKAPMVRFLENLPPSNSRFVYYPEGWHMLPRDLNHSVVIEDILAFMNDPKGSLRSGFEDKALEKLKEDL